jgi:hypothetical protein
MIKSARRLAAALTFLVPALAAADAPVTTEQAGTVVVVTPQAPVVITNQQAPQAQVVQAPDDGPITSPSMTPAVDPDAPQVAPAPQNQAWSNVSHINGTVVPVGEQNKYLYAFKKTNISSNPIGWIFGFYGVSLSHALSNNIAIRADANYMSIDHETGYEVGISMPIYFRRTYSGPFLEPGLIVRGSSHDDSYYADCFDCSSSSDQFVGPEMLFGWQWMFDSGLNIAGAFGAARNISSRSMDTSDSDKITAAGYFRIGYAF